MAAELQLSPAQSPAPTQNSAPIQPLLRLKRGGAHPSSYLQKAVQELWTDLHRKDQTVWREIHNVGQLVSLFLDGQQFLCRDPFTGGWGALPISNTDQRPLNILNNVKQNLLTKWENSNPDIVIRPGRNLNRAQSAAKMADVVNDYYERQFYHTHFTQQECLAGLSFGTYIDRYRYDDAKVSMSILQDVFETKDAQFGEGFGFCGDCQHGGPASEFQRPGGDGPLSLPKCPNCQSTAVAIDSPSSGPLRSATGQCEHQQGDLVCELLPLSACRYDLAKRPEDSSWFMYRQEIPKNDVTRILGNVLLPEGRTDDDNGLEVLRGLQRQGQPFLGKSTGGTRRDQWDSPKKDIVIFEELWVSPSEYAHINLIGGEKTVSGDEIPKGKLTDYFPDGFCAVGLNGMSVVLALYPEKHRDHIVSGTWFMRPLSGAGRGLVDSVEVQKLFNTMNNQALQYMTATYTPAIGYDNSIWTGNKMKYIGTPRTNIPFDLTKLPEGRKLHDSIYQFQPTAMPSQFFNFAQNFMNILMQKTSMVSDFNQGEPGIAAQNTTATAAEIDQSNADAINQPIFKIKADARRRGAELTIKLFRQHFPMKRYFDLGGRYGRQQGIELSGADINTDLVFEVARNSEMPKGPFERRRNRMQFFNSFGGFEGYAMAQQAMPKLVREVEQDFDVDFQTEDYDAVNELCLKRLQQMEEAVRVGVTDPMILVTEAIQPPISVVEKDLKDKAEWFADWISTDDGLAAPAPLRKAAILLAQGQFQGAIAQQTEIAGGEGQVAAAQAAPMAIGGAMLEQQGQQESTEPDPTAVLQMQQEMAQQQHESQESSLDREHELKVIEAEGARDKQVASHDAKEKIKIERSKPKPVVRKASTKK